MTDYTYATKVNRYDYTSPESTAKVTRKDALAEQAIIDTLKYMGWMSLKDSDHCEMGKAVGQGDARRRAADRMIADGRIILLGTWSNGIAVGPGNGFMAVTVSQEATPAPAKKIVTRKPRARETKPATWRMVEGRCDMLPAHPMYDTACAARSRIMLEAARQDTADFFSSREGAHSPMRYADGASCKANIIRAAFRAPKPRVRYTWPKIAEVPPIITPEPAPVISAPPTPIYEPAVGESVFLVLRHENGTTTDRVVDVQRVKIENGVVVLFRGYDRRRDRCRNYVVADCLVLRQWDGLEVCDMNGRVVVEARRAA